MLPALQAAVRSLVARQEILAARVRDTGTPSGPEFFFERPGPEVKLQVIDLTREPVDERIGRARQLARSLIWQPFQSDAGPWFRAFVISLDATEHVVGFVVHHFIADGWSTAIMKGELLGFYVCEARGGRSTFAPLPLRYTDYVLGMNEWLSGAGAELSAAYWRQLLTNAPPTRVPPDYCATADDVGILATQRRHLAPEALASIRRVGRDCGVLLSTLVTAALAAALWDSSGATDIVIVTRTSGRSHPALLGVVGAFFDSFAVRIRVDPDATFEALARHIQHTLALSKPHQDYPYQLVRSCLPDIGASDIAPMLNFFDAPDSAAARKPANVTSFPLPDPPLARYPAGHFTGFHLIVTADASGLSTTAEYLDILYKEVTAASLVSTLCSLLVLACGDPRRTLSALLPLARSAHTQEPDQGQGVRAHQLSELALESL